MTTDLSQPQTHFGGFIGRNRSAVPLNFAGFPDTRAFDVNDAGWFAGTWAPAFLHYRGYLARYDLDTGENEIYDLGIFPGFEAANAYSINNANTVVGGATVLGGDFQKALIWPTGSLIPQDLNNFVNIPGATLIQAYRINNAGQILAEARLDGGGYAYYRLDPIQEWTHTGDGTWSVASNWFGPLPNALQHAANFKSAITAPAVIYNDTSHTVGTITFDNTHSYTLAGPGPITLDDFNAGQIDVLSGSHVIDAPLVFEGNASLDVAPGSALTIGNPQSSPTTILTKTGAGELAMKRYRAASLNIAAGTAKVIAGGGDDATSRVEMLSIAGAPGAWVAGLDIADAKLIIDYTSASPIAIVSDQIRSGYANGAWNGAGIASASAASSPATGVGYAEAGELELSTFGGVEVDSTSLLLAFTLYGDANLDLVADIADFSNLAANFNLPGRWFTGDFNYDAITDIGDFALLAANFNRTLGSLQKSTVPEPSAAVLLAVVGSLRRRRWGSTTSIPQTRAGSPCHG